MNSTSSGDLKLEIQWRRPPLPSTSGRTVRAGHGPFSKRNQARENGQFLREQRLAARLGM